jgi:hypothetical protein
MKSATMSRNGGIPISAATYAATLFLNINQATQFAFYGNLFLPATVHNQANANAVERAYRYTAVLIGQNLDIESDINSTLISAASPGSYLISLLNAFITQEQRLCILAVQSGGIWINDQISQQIMFIVNTMRTTIILISELFNRVGNGAVMVQDGINLLNAYMVNILNIIDAEVKEDYTRSLQRQAQNQVLGLQIADFITRALHGGREIDFGVNQPRLQGYNVPDTISLDILRDTAADDEQLAQIALQLRQL